MVQYLYVKNNPLVYIDLDGEIPFLAVTAILGAVVGGVKGVSSAIKSGKSVGQTIKAGVVGATVGAVVGAGLGALAGIATGGGAMVAVTGVAKTLAGGAGIASTKTGITTAIIATSMTSKASNILGTAQGTKGKITAKDVKEAVVESSKVGLTIAAMTQAPIRAVAASVGVVSSFNQAKEAAKEKKWVNMALHTGVGVLNIGIAVQAYFETFACVKEIAKPILSAVKGTVKNDPLNIVEPEWVDDMGNIMWPPNNGAMEGTEEMINLRKGIIFGRIGSDRGTFVAPPKTSPDKLSLAPGTDVSKYIEYKVIKPIIGVEKAIVAPWFDKPGGGIQFKLPMTIRELIENGFIIPK